MRWAKSYSIVDHQLLHQGYFHRLQVESMALYLFLVTVSNREGRSFYSHKKIKEILRLNEQSFAEACDQLIKEGLIDYKKPYWWVKNLEAAHPSTKRIARNVNKYTRSDSELKSLKDIFDELFHKGDERHRP